HLLVFYVHSLSSQSFTYEFYEDSFGSRSFIQGICLCSLKSLLFTCWVYEYSPDSQSSIHLILYDFDKKSTIPVLSLYIWFIL
ncbi:hypothetical protein, partial [Priestia megaterium]|uniref:hypothetical protein n=1 Tax=Priestia megaterium TaxID=1404 RepID=UPI00300BB640